MEEEDEPTYEDMMAKPRTGTQHAVASVLKLNDEKKLAKRVGVEGKKAVLGEKVQVKRGAADDDDDEGAAKEAGPILEGLVEVAAEKRAIQRGDKRGATAGAHMDTSMQLGDDGHGAEEAFEAPADEDAELFEPFNLNEEREHGYFDANGNYVEYKEEKHSGDAWLEGVKVDETLAAKVAASAAAPEPEKLGEVGMAKLKRTIASILQPEETVLRALKRLGTRVALADATLKAQFDTLTECASDLMANGEYEVYSDTKRVFERDAAMYAPVEAADDDDNMDMFGGGGSDDDSKPKPAKKAKVEQATSAGAAGTAERAAAALPVPVPAEQKEDATDYASWPLAELRRFLVENGEDASSCVEKADVVAKVAATAKRLHAETSWNPTACGYAFDASSGYYYCAASGLYYDPPSAGFFNHASNRWYTYDAATSEYVEMLQKS